MIKGFFRLSENLFFKSKIPLELKIQTIFLNYGFSAIFIFAKIKANPTAYIISTFKERGFHLSKNVPLVCKSAIYRLV